MGFQAVLRLDLVDSMGAARSRRQHSQDPPIDLGPHPDPASGIARASLPTSGGPKAEPGGRASSAGGARGLRSSRETSSGSLAPKGNRGVDRQSVKFAHERIAWREGVQMPTCIGKLAVPNTFLGKTAFLVGGERLF